MLKLVNSARTAEERMISLMGQPRRNNITDVQILKVCFQWEGEGKFFLLLQEWSKTRLSLKCSAWKGFINFVSKKFSKKF